MKNPVTQYPKPPFPRQPQEPPGLAGKMDPLPDHGEKSYRGSGRLEGRKALITGGDSGIGRAAAIAFAREGADVAIGFLPEEKSDAAEVIELIRAEGRKAVPLPGDIREESFCEKLVANAVQQLGGLDILVNNAGKQQAVDSILELGHRCNPAEGSRRTKYKNLEKKPPWAGPANPPSRLRFMFFWRLPSRVTRRVRFTAPRAAAAIPERDAIHLLTALLQVR
jgi:hypothetical protein